MYIVLYKNLYEYFYKSKELFDFSSYLKVSNYYRNSNNFVVGKMKDGTCSMPMEGFL